MSRDDRPQEAEVEMSDADSQTRNGKGVSRRKLLAGSGALAGLPALASLVGTERAFAQMASGTKPNILVIWGDDIGWQNVSAYGLGTMGYRTPNLDRIAREGIKFTDHYAQPSCTAGRAAFMALLRKCPRDSVREFSGLMIGDEQTAPRPLPHDELEVLQRSAGTERIASGLV